LISTHLISEFEGLIDEFTIIDRGRSVLTQDADSARAQHQQTLEEIFVSTLQPRGAVA
jgi:ABC-type Na+ transport system ATPase subunit NatA